MTVIDVGQLIACRPDKGGRPYVAGTGVSVARFAALVDEGLSAEEMHREVFGGSLTLAQVHAALACYFQNRAEIDEDIRRRNEEYDRAAAASDSLADGR